MAINIGPTVKRRREWARMTQQELVDQTRMERSASYISAIENGRTSPTLEETEQLARYFRTDLISFLQEALEDSERRGQVTAASAPGEDDRVERYFGALEEADQELALEFMQLLARHRAHR